MSEDVDDSLPLRAKARPAHLARVKELAAQGRVLVGGPHPAIDSEDPGSAGFSGSLIIADFRSLEDAKAWTELDPYVDAGVYRSVSVKPFRVVVP
jgi:hypothetical protein